VINRELLPEVVGGSFAQKSHFRGGRPKGAKISHPVQRADKCAPRRPWITITMTVKL
jgi:hypothetical protein